MFYYRDRTQEFWQETDFQFPVTPNIQQWGQTVFENCRTYDGHIFRLESHLSRLFESAEILDIPHSWSLEEIGQKAETIVSQSDQSTDLTVRIFLSAEFFYLHTEPLKSPNPEIYTQGVEIIETLFERNFAAAKYPNPAYKFFAERQEPGVFETIFFDGQGNLREGNISNVFAIFKSEKITLVTPEQNILHGITRDQVLKVAEDKKWNIETREIHTTELESADEICLTNTSKEVIPVRKWEAWENNNFEVAQELKRDFRH